MLKRLSQSSQETKELAKEILKDLSSNLICLYGPLGSGKTTFVQGLARALGIKKRIISPTFILLREYDIKSLKFKIKNSKLIHLDCYRINSEEDIKSIDLSELWSDNKNLVVIEWAEKLKRILPKQRIDIKFEHVSKNKRKITIVD